MGFDLNKTTKLTIGRLARESGLSITTVRYYQQRGLLRRPERPPTGSFRSYSDGDLERLQLIRQTQEMGFTLAEISELLAHVDQGNCQEIRTMADRRLQYIKEQIKLLDGKRRVLSALLAGCGPDCGNQCVLVKALRDPSQIVRGSGKSYKRRP